MSFRPNCVSRLTRFCSSELGDVASVAKPRNAPLAGNTFPDPAGPVKKLAGYDPATGIGVAARTAEVAADVADCEPYRFEAVTTTRIVEPESPLDSEYEELVDPLTATHDAPALSQRRHWYAYEVGEPLQVPGDAESV